MANVHYAYVTVQSLLREQPDGGWAPIIWHGSKLCPALEHTNGTVKVSRRRAEHYERKADWLSCRRCVVGHEQAA